MFPLPSFTPGLRATPTLTEAGLICVPCVPSFAPSAAAPGAPLGPVGVPAPLDTSPVGDTGASGSDGWDGVAVPSPSPSAPPLDDTGRDRPDFSPEPFLLVVWGPWSTFVTWPAG